MMKKSIIKTLVLGAVVALGFTSCNDAWNEHYQEKPELNPTETLWDIITSHSELSEFADMLKRTGYDKLLQENRYYTVWAPKNGFDYEESNDSLVQAEFVENHVADYGHNATGVMEDNKVKMINKKYISFNGSDNSYTFKGNPLTQKNITAKNGILHIIDGYASFTANIWEQLAKMDSLSEVNSFLKSFNEIVFDQNNSVQGPIVNGEITYLDSVVSEKNTWFSRIGYLNKEDSAYVMIAPTNKAWNELYEKARSYYVYASTTPKGDSLQTYYAKAAITNHLVFSKSINHLKEGMEPIELDSIISNYRSNRLIFYDEEVQELFANQQEKYELSNGDMYVVDKLNYDPLMCWHDTIKIEGENSTYIEGSTCTSSVSYITKDSVNLYKKISRAGYGIYAPTTSTGNPKLTVTLPGVLSAPYLVKCVFVPDDIIDKTLTETLLPNKFTAQLKYKDVNGKTQTLSLGSKLENDPTRIDTMTFIPNAKDITTDYFHFPVNEAHLLEGEETAAQLIITSAVTSREKNYDRTFRIDCIMLIPIDEETYGKDVE